VLRIQREHEAKVKKLTEEAFLIEQEQKRAEAETLAALSRAAAQENGAGDANWSDDDPYAQHPLRQFIKGADPEPVATIAARSAPTPISTKSEVWRVVKHAHGNNFANSGTSYLLEKEIKKQTGIHANTQRLDHLSSLYDEADLMKALSLAVAAFRERPLSHDGFLGFVESLLLEAENVTA
jgi:hypothetical protein